VFTTFRVSKTQAIPNKSLILASLDNCPNGLQEKFIQSDLASTMYVIQERSRLTIYFRAPHTSLPWVTGLTRKTNKESLQHRHKAKYYNQ
jgi:hypothetical protein